jgi:glycosyltransferase involved in cell wall biosynthesis
MITEHDEATADAGRVTWLLPVLNGMPFLGETLASLAAQTSRGARIIAWDNGSHDGTVDVLRHWIPSRLPGEVVAGRPLPLGACLAALVEAASTPLCARIDADDVADPERLARQIAFMDRHPEIVACGTQMTTMDAEGRDFGAYPERPLDDADLMLVSIVETPLSHPTVMFRRDAVLAAGNYRDLSAVEDLDLWLRLAAIGRLGTLPDRLVRYRVHDKSVTAHGRRDPVQLRERVTDVVAEHAANVLGITAGECRALRERRVRFALPLLVRVARHIERRTGRPWIRTLGSAWLRSRWVPLLSPYDLPTRAALMALRGKGA